MQTIQAGVNDSVSEKYKKLAEKENRSVRNLVGLLLTNLIEEDKVQDFIK